MTAPPVRPGAATKLLLSGMLVVAGCSAPADTPVIRPLRPLPSSENQAATPRLNGYVGTTDRPLSPTASYGRDRVPVLRSIGADSGSGSVMLDFADTDIREVVAQVLGTLLHADYTIDPAVRGTVTLHASQKLSRAQLLPALRAMLAQVNAALLARGSR